MPWQKPVTKKQKAKPVAVSPEENQRLIAEAESKGFKPMIFADDNGNLENGDKAPEYAEN